MQPTRREFLAMLSAGFFGTILELERASAQEISLGRLRIELVAFYARDLNDRRLTGNTDELYLGVIGTYGNEKVVPEPVQSVPKSGWGYSGEERFNTQTTKGNVPWVVHHRRNPSRRVVADSVVPAGVRWLTLALWEMDSLFNGNDELGILELDLRRGRNTRWTPVSHTQALTSYRRAPTPDARPYRFAGAGASYTLWLRTIWS